MKRIIKGLSLFILVVLSLTIIFTENVKALSKQTSYININDNINDLTIDNLSFSNITFKDYSSISTLSFGLTGVVVNNSDKTIDYTSTVYYYDSSYSLIAQGYNSSIAIEGTNHFNLMSNLSILDGHNINEIYYYRLAINTTSSLSTESNIVSNTPSKNSQFKSYDYVIDKYDINIIVNENNTLDITETITAYFNVAKHGIFRTIPLRNTITRLDGTISKNRTQITNLSVNTEYTTSRENDNYKIQIGSANRTLTGEQTYVIKYTYNLGKDPIKNYDELYYNIVGDGWDTVIGNITFNVTMPKKFDTSKLGFSSGLSGSINNNKVQYNVNGNQIIGNYNGILDVGETLTIRCELDEGYFVGAGLTISIIDYLFFLLPILFLGIAMLLWYKFGRDEQVVETVEFYPPEGLNSLEVGFLYKGKADDKDVTSLLIYLANKGYIKIEETEKSLESQNFKITKLKEYDGNNLNEQMFLEGLFINRSSVTFLNLYNKFYITMKKILSNINDEENKNKIFEKKASSKSIFIILMMLITYCFITILPVFTYGKIEKIGYAFFLPLISVVVIFKTIFRSNRVKRKVTVDSIIATYLYMLVWIMFGGMPWFSIVFPALLQDSIYLIGYVIGIGCILGMLVCLKYLSKRTEYGNEMLGKIRGFKNFLETAEKEKLETMVMQEPTYFYNILPYTYVLDVSDTWIKKFETISLRAPSWYESQNSFDIIAFGSFMNNTMISAQSVMSSSPSSSSDSSGNSSFGGDGSSSGGGFSGGGSGGGGGGSW